MPQISSGLCPVPVSLSRTMAGAWKSVMAYWNYLFVILVPVLLLPLPIIVSAKEARCAYVIIIMALFWCTEALPLAITALLPVILFPLMGIMESEKVCMEYLKDTNMLFIGGLLVATAVEQWNLHKRIALQVLLIIGVRPALLILGFMVVTAFLSMWISNTATTAMMVPIAHAVLDQLYNSNSGEAEEGTVNHSFELQEPVEPTPEKGAPKQDNGFVPAPLNSSSQLQQQLQLQQRQKKEEHYRFSQGISLCVCYAASIGGIATLTGTTPNLVLQGQINSIFPDNSNVVNFASWFIFAFPTMIILLLLAWIWIQVLFLGVNFRKNFSCGGREKERERAAFRIIKEEQRMLGPMTFAEVAITIIFVLLVLLWFTREPGFIPGWGTVAFPNEKGESMATDATVAIFIGVILFIVPSEIPCCLCSRTRRRQQEGSREKSRAPQALLNWKMVNDKMPWNIVLLLGGGFALAKGSEASGLSLWLGNKLTPLQNISPSSIALILCLLVATFTECTSNVATTTLFLPILASLSQAICLNPLYVMLPCTLSASLAFMLPVATPPNAIVFSFGQLKVSDMAKAGFLLNILGVLVISLAINSWAYPIFSLDSFPSWAMNNGTAQCFNNGTNSTL
ncbi:solute carrier family 13 member 2 [Tachyglossus aculeatus]|uniref:solute carrier family 13 member 2 n=1 Tax=Tachyglossus aculeatus TaxID=9261 RepID=UPI0018F528CC|nr:solute carrier family 13 member 2 [Tachyglossus aculeatus]